MKRWLARHLLAACLPLGAPLCVACSSDSPNPGAGAGAGGLAGATSAAAAGSPSSEGARGGATSLGGVAGAATAGSPSSDGGSRAGGAGSASGADTGGAASGGSSGTSASSGGAGAGGSRYDGPLPASVSDLFPLPGATSVCVDAPLTITFSSPPSIGQSGTIRVYAKASPTTPVDSIDVAATSFTGSVGGQSRNFVRPIFIDDKTAVVYFRSGKLAPNTSYFVNVSAGAFVDAQQKPLGAVTDATSWTFTTGAAPAVSAAISVDRLGGGDFCTLQAAFDALPSDGAARTITLAPRTHYEQLYLSAKKNLKLRGADRALSVLSYPNNDKLNPGTSARPLFYANGSTGLGIENLTIYNTTPQGGSQAEALRIAADQVTLRSVTLKSLQDTLLSTGKVYVVDSYIEGNVDFIWGNGPTYFERSEIKTVGRAGAIVQARNGSSGYGFVFVDSKLTADPQVSGQVLARIDASVYPASNVAFIDCQMTAIASKGWTITPQGTSDTAQLRFWEYGSTDGAGKALSVSGRDPASKQLSAAEASALRDKATVLGGWDPP